VKSLEIFFRRLLLSLFLLFRKREQRYDSPTITGSSKVLFIRLNRIGDALVSTPLLKLIKEQIGCEVYILASKNNHFVFESPDLIDKIIVFNKNLRSIPSLIKLINSYNFDVIVDLHDDVSSTVSYIMAFTKSKYKFGLQKSNDKLFTHIVNKLDPSKYHVIERVMEFGKLFQLKADSQSVNIFYVPKQESVLLADSFIENHFNPKMFLLGINISAGSDARFWGVYNYRSLIDMLIPYKFNILLMCAETDLQQAFAISENKIPIYYRPNFDEFCAVIPKLDLLFTPDTSIVHVASAFKTPVFGLYVKYNTKDKIWSPYKSQFDYVVTEEPTLHNITVESVKKKFIPFLEKFYYEYTNKNL